MQNRYLRCSAFLEHHCQQPVDGLPRDLGHTLTADIREHVQRQLAGVRFLAIRLDVVIGKELRHELGQRHRRLVGRAGRGELRLSVLL
jgi:hypothetical protein